MRFCSSGVGGAELFASGSADFGVNGGSGDLELMATGLPSQALGIFFYGSLAQPASPLGSGFLCVGGGQPNWRLDVVSVGTGESSASTQVDYLTPPSPAAQIVPGSTWNFQFWFRSAGTTDLTDALEIKFVPPIALPTPVTILEFNRSGHPLGQLFEGGIVIANTDTEWSDLWSSHWSPASNAPPLPPLDMNLTTVVGIFAGHRLNQGYSISLADIALSVTTLEITTIENQPGAGCGALFSESNPMMFIALRKIDGAVLGTWNPQVNIYSCP